MAEVLNWVLVMAQNFPIIIVSFYIFEENFYESFTVIIFVCLKGGSDTNCDDAICGF